MRSNSVRFPVTGLPLRRMYSSSPLIPPSNTNHPGTLFMSWSWCSQGGSERAVYGPGQPGAHQHGHHRLRAGGKTNPRRDHLHLPNNVLPANLAMGSGDKVRSLKDQAVAAGSNHIVVVLLSFQKQTTKTKHRSRRWGQCSECCTFCGGGGVLLITRQA